MNSKIKQWGTALLAALALLLSALTFVGGGTAPASADGDGWNVYERRFFPGQSGTAIWANDCAYLSSGQTYTFDMTGLVGAAADVVHINATVVNPWANGFATFYNGGSRPSISQLSWTANEGKQVNSFQQDLDSSDRFFVYVNGGATICLDLLQAGF